MGRAIGALISLTASAGGLSRELRWAQDKLVEPDAFHSCLQPYTDFSTGSEVDQGFRRIGSCLAGDPFPALPYRPLCGQVAARVRPEDVLVALVDRVRDLHIEPVRLRYAHRGPHPHADPAAVRNTALNLDLEDHMRVLLRGRVHLVPGLGSAEHLAPGGYPAGPKLEFG